MHHHEEHEEWGSSFPYDQRVRSAPLGGVYAPSGASPARPGAPRGMRFRASLRRCPGPAVSLCTLALVLAFGSAVGAQDRKPQGPPATPVAVAPVVSRDVAEQVVLVGTAGAVSESTVAAEVGGIVEDFPVDEGRAVTRGEVLVRLRATDLELRRKAAVADRDRIRAQLESAALELARVERLNSAGSIAQQRYDEVRFDHQALTASLARSEADIELLSYQITRKTVRAPFGGIVAREHTERGEWVGAGGPVATLMDLRRVRVMVDMPERYVAQLAPDATVDVRISSLDDLRCCGRVEAVLPQGNPAARSFPVRVDLENPGMKILSGMEAVATFQLTGRRQALLVPKDAVVTAGTLKQVYVVEDGRVRQLQVEVQGYYDDSVAVSGDLAAGDRVVVRGNERLRPGQEVKIIGAEAPN